MISDEPCEVAFARGGRIATYRTSAPATVDERRAAADRLLAQEEHRPGTPSGLIRRHR